ncbi:hypothetical protein IAG44_17715 [Streptomyces roseirectus]|uniref:Uncharacterized protein n=1 Tax=Streptomyces roseirectus TaxID=2768066 RepID=A0A7H0IE77_9ACTN|nr:hypothetical protein IAG44_17715 [Streptomyces roseirectus]
MRVAPGASVCLVTYRAATDVLRRLMTSTTGPVLLVPPDPLRLGFAGLVDNVTLGARPLPPDLAPLADALPYAFLSAEYTDGADLDEATWSTVTAARLTAHLPDTPVLICLAAPPTPALATALDHARARGACVLRLIPATPEPT